MDWGIVARGLHVVAVVVWIGGVWFVTTVLLPRLQHERPDTWIEEFRAIERRFGAQARACVAVVLLSGLYMLYAYRMWNRFTQAAFWWMHVMIGVWLLFAVLLFAVEPIASHRQIGQRAAGNPRRALGRVLALHRLLLALSIVAVFVSICGAHGLFY
ncbi:MAG TPA: hypothetical protein VN858_08565 [Casimicrobiaceae bacterium]|nr:hypothetical protein [Casimicrobiaceae bacterium]